MEINKQLFEDVLSGKLKGKFVLRNGNTFDGKCLKRAENTTLYYNPFYPYYLISDDSCASFFESSYTEGGMWCRGGEFSNDIIEFIPDTDMKENELTIKLPKGKIVDWDESKKQNKIVLKDKQLTYEDICKKLFENKEIFYTEIDGTIDSGQYSEIKDYICDKNNTSSKRQLECILAKNQLANVATFLNAGWKPEKENIVYGLALEGENKKILIPTYMWDAKSYIAPQFTFKTYKFVEQAIEILGEETVKLALEPLGI